MGQEGKGEEGCERQKGARGRTGRHEMCFVKLKWGKVALTHLLSHIRNKKRQINHQNPSCPHILKKQQHWLWKTEETKNKNGCSEIVGEVTTLRFLHKQETEARGGSRSGGRHWDHSVWSFNLCVIGGEAKDCWRGEKGDGPTKIQRGWEREERKLNGPFFAEHRHSLCIVSSFKSTYTICSCRLVDILV